MARTLEDALLMYNVIAVQHPLDPHSVPFGPVEVPERSVTGCRIVVSEVLGNCPVDAAIRDNLAAAASALESQGAVTEHRNPDWTVEEIMTVAMAHYGHTPRPGYGGRHRGDRCRSLAVHHLVHRPHHGRRRAHAAARDLRR
ncbi:hypothetical protein [Corynebacterium variabile]|uniref:hypothetical protein n=1 Tax=Corynebacterium variabile TaxID=1727 RepID=UPI00289F3589|nr:hypothetical protein [Corynebacterium variabile]